MKKHAPKICLQGRLELKMIKSRKSCFEISSLRYILKMIFLWSLIKDLKANLRKKKRRLKAVRALRVRKMVLRIMVISYKTLMMCNQRFQARPTNLAILEHCLTAAFLLTNRDKDPKRTLSIKDQELQQLASTLVSSVSQTKINPDHWTLSL